MDALYDDLNTPKAMAAINELTRDEKDAARLKGQLLKTGLLFGILQQDPEVWFGYGVTGGDVDGAMIESMLAERQAAKKAKDFSRADAIRKELEGKGIVIEDTPDGPKWRKAG